MTVVLGGWALKRPGDTVNSLAAAAFIILLWEPRQLFEAGFQLSFFVVLVIALMLPPLNRICDRLLAGRSVAPGRIAPALAAGAPARRCDVVALLCALVRGLDRLDSAGGKVFSPVQPRFNAGEHRRRAARHARADGQSGRLVCGTWFPWATVLFNHSAWFFMSAMTAVSEFSTRIPGAYFYVPAPSWLTILHLLRRAHRLG